LTIGGGPAGLVASERLARQGFSVVLCEEHDRVGNPVHCTGVLATESFSELDLPTSATLNTLQTARFVSPSGITVDYTPSTPMAAVIDRPAFDRALAARATAAGVDFRVGARVRDVRITSDGVRASIGDTTITASLLVLACGASYGWQRRLGLGLPRRYLHSAQRELPAARLSDVELHFGRDTAPDGFAWAVPIFRASGTFVRVGAMASRDALGCYHAMLDRIRERWQITTLEGDPRQKLLPLGAIAHTFSDRVLVVGDAAGLVKPTTGGGIHYSIVSAGLAAEVAARALARRDLGASALAPYESAWQRALSDEFEAQHELRSVVTRLSDREIDDFFELARTDGIMPIVRATARFNHHRPLIRALLKHPPARRGLFDSVFG
jgi:geranylgeranyl reductase family protein